MSGLSNARVSIWKRQCSHERQQLLFVIWSFGCDCEAGGDTNNVETTFLLSVSTLPHSPTACCHFFEQSRAFSPDLTYLVMWPLLPLGGTGVKGILWDSLIKLLRSTAAEGRGKSTPHTHIHTHCIRWLLFFVFIYRLIKDCENVNTLKHNNTAHSLDSMSHLSTGNFPWAWKVSQ